MGFWVLGMVSCAFVMEVWDWVCIGGKLFQADGTLEEVDPEIAEIIKNEKGRQVRSAGHMQNVEEI